MNVLPEDSKKIIRAKNLDLLAASINNNNDQQEQKNNAMDKKPTKKQADETKESDHMSPKRSYTESLQHYGNESTKFAAVDAMISSTTMTTSSSFPQNPARRRQKTTQEMICLAPDFKPGTHDVICGRGKTALTHVGNLNYRKLVEENLETYSRSTTKIEKIRIVSSVVETIRQRSPAGGFVKKINGRWYEVGNRHSREKVGQAFRDSLHNQYSSSTKAKAAKKRLLRKTSKEHEGGAIQHDGAAAEAIVENDEQEQARDSVNIARRESFPSSHDGSSSD